MASTIVIKSMAGEEVLQFSPVPKAVHDLKQLIQDTGYMRMAFQKLVHEACFEICADDDILEDVDQVLVLVRDDRPLWNWDLEGNPAKDMLDINEAIVKCPKLRHDYTNVLTREPIDAGLHYFEIVLHHYGDEQWCGLTPDRNMAGPEYEKAIPSKTSWTYYTGRSKGALEAQGRKLKDFEFVGRSGNTIGMLVDCDGGAVAFDLNGSIQGACEIPRNTPLWVITHLDTPRDHVELRKPSLQDAPPVHFDALKGALLNVSEGTVMSRNY